MIDREKETSIEEKIVEMDEWMKKLVEHQKVDKLDRGVLRDVLEHYGANFEIDDRLREKLGREHYSSNIRRTSISAIWGEDMWNGMVDWTKQYVDKMDEGEVEVPVLNKSGKKHIGSMGLIEELTTYAATNEEDYSYLDFRIRMTLRAFNGFTIYELGSKEKIYRGYLIVPGYNEITYEFTQKGYEGDVRHGELPFAPAGFSPQYARGFWDKMKDGF